MRQLRADFAGALHHVYSRGIDGRDILRHDRDRLFFLSRLGQVVEKFGWIVHVNTLMSNHFHLMIETPESNLSRRMQQQLTNYAQMFNATSDGNAQGRSRKRRRRRGALFEGRFKSHVVEKESHLLELSRDRWSGGGAAVADDVVGPTAVRSRVGALRCIAASSMGSNASLGTTSNVRSTSEGAVTRNLWRNV